MKLDAIFVSGSSLLTSETGRHLQKHRLFDVLNRPVEACSCSHRRPSEEKSSSHHNEPSPLRVRSLLSCSVCSQLIIPSYIQIDRDYFIIRATNRGLGFGVWGLGFGVW